MLRLIKHGVGLMILFLLLAPAGFSKTGAEKTDLNPKKTDDATAVTSPDPITTPDTAKADATGTSDAASPPAPAPAAQTAPSGKKDTNDDYKPAPVFTPMLATTGTLGLFTLETGDTIPKHGLNFSAFGNKFGRMPGSVTVLEVGVDLSYGITDNLNLYAAFDPYGHVHIGCPGQLSLRSIPLSSTCAPLATGTPIPNSFFPVEIGRAHV
jgi:hypothetical protein